jgi:hypothetical protein
MGGIALPEVGGVLDQPAVVMEAFSIIRAEIGRFEDEQRRLRDKERQQQKTASGGRNTTVRH